MKNKRVFRPIFWKTFLPPPGRKSWDFSKDPAFIMFFSFKKLKPYMT